MAIGYLLIQARTAHDALPLSGVQIRVTDMQGNSVYELTTDENGETQKVPLETMNKSFSQNPYFFGLPYTSYNLLAQKNGFNSLYISDIPIFDGETAVLPLALVPMQALQRRPTQTDISIGKPAVAMNETRNQEGTSVVTALGRRPVAPSMPETTGTQQTLSSPMEEVGQPLPSSPMSTALEQLQGTDDSSRILRQVVIPNPITVHLGTPNSAAANVQVSFPDYVKNVASSEI